MPRGGFCLSLFPQEGKRRGVFEGGESGETERSLVCFFSDFSLFFSPFFLRFVFSALRA